jgi:adenine-specific DNA-methyltransferase
MNKEASKQAVSEAERTARRKKDSARLVWDTKPRRAPNPRDIEFQTAEIVIPNPERDLKQLPLGYTGEAITVGKPGQLALGGSERQRGWTYEARDQRPLRLQEIDKSKVNRLIWGDNLLAMQALLAQGYEGKVELIYIDPPFDSKADYSHRLTIEGEEITKEPSVIERLAYKDTWAGGLDSYLDMLYPRLQLMRRLLSDTGSIYLHLDWHVGHYAKALMDEVFGAENFGNEIVWQKVRASKSQTVGFGNIHDTILFYGKGCDVTFQPQYVSYPDSYKTSHYGLVEEGSGRRYGLWDFTQAGGGTARRFGDKLIEPPPGKHWIWSQDRIDEGMQEGRIVFTSTGTPRLKRYLDEARGNTVEDIWTDIYDVNAVARERVGYPTQKPEALLERVLQASSRPGDLLMDCFAGSGTTPAVAEKLNRRWVACELGKVGIQVCRARLVEMGARPFLIENVGNYQREMIYLSGGRIYEMLKIILKLFGATPRKDYQGLGTRKGEDGQDELVFVGYPDRPVTARRVEELAKMADKLDGRGYRKLIVLAWDYDYNYSTELEKRLKSLGEKIKLKVESRMIPPDIYEHSKRPKTNRTSSRSRTR